MVVAIVWAVAAGLVLVILGILGYGLYGQLRRLQKAVAAVQADIVPAVAALRPDPGPGRHRAD